MNRLSLVAIAVLSLCGTVAAAAASDPSPAPLTRAEVHREAIRANRAGELHSGEDTGYPQSAHAPSPSTKTRAAVKQEVKTAAATRSLSGTGDEVGYPYADQPKTTPRARHPKATPVSGVTAVNP
jgi:hypothetical protein